MKTRGPDGQLMRLRAEQPPLDADPVAEVEQRENLDIERRQRVLADVNLDLRAAVGDGQKARLPNERMARMRRP